MDLDQRGDDDLVRAAKRGADPNALQVLVLRHWVSIKRWIGRAAGHSHLRPEDVRDAEQEAFFAVPAAVEEFDPEQVGRSRRCTFPTFLAVRVMSRYRNFVKRIGRAQRRLQPLAEAGMTSAEGLNELASKPAHLVYLHRPPEDPAAAAEALELMAVLRDALAGLDARKRWIVEQHLAGRSLRDIAAELGQLHHEVKRLWNKIRLRLMATLKDWIG